VSADRWQLLRDIVDAASQLPAGARRAYLDDTCGDDPALRREVESLLRAGDEGSAFLKGPVGAAARDWAEAPSYVGRRLGAYEVTRELGRGGMGAVYLAVRADDEYRKHVAVKLIRGGADDSEMRRRFLIERQILANLEHPSIARLLDGGTSDDDRPYVVMEYVDGEPLDAYCDRHRLPIDERLRLFRRVCDAVQFAHSNLVVHRDLKPGNILVTPDGVPKLLDFGIAKLLDAPGEPAVTRTAMRPMTPAYASPEQVRSEPITTATDVYALGVLLCELLSGRGPYRLTERTPQAVEAAITTQPPERPSAALLRVDPSEDGEGQTRVTPDAVAEARGTTPERLRRRLTGDLDTIALMALRKEPGRRYASVEQLSDDVGRYLDGLPVRARPDTLGYRAGKFVRRHRAGVAAAGAMVALVAALTGVYTVRLARERDRARAEADKAAQVATFLTDLFEAVDPEQAQGREVTARQLLEAGAGRIERELAGQPALQATMMGVIGGVYQSLGDYPEASRLLEGAVALRRGPAGGDALELAATLHDLGDLAEVKGEYARAESLLTAALAMRRERLAAPHALVVQTLTILGLNETDRGDFPHADSLLGEAVAMGRQLPPSEDHTKVLGAALDYLGRLRVRQARFAEADTILREALERRRSALGEDHPSVGASLDALAEVLRRDSRLPEAEAMFRDAVAHARRILGEDHPAVTGRMGNLAIALDDQGRYAEAIALHREVLAKNREVLGATHPNVAKTLNNLAATYTRSGDHDQAERLYLESLAIHRGNYGEEHPSIATVLNNLAHTLAEKHDFAGAAGYQRRALAMDRALLGDEHAFVGQDLVLVGIFLLADGQVAASEQPLREGVAVMRQALGPDHRGTAVALYGLGKYLAAARRFAEGDSVTRDVLRIRQAALPEGHWETALAETLLGEILAGMGRDAEAEPLLVNGYEIVRVAQPLGSRNRGEARDRVVRFFRSRGQGTRADSVPP
jgi:serine/threonine-protein kinase